MMEKAETLNLTIILLKDLGHLVLWNVVFLRWCYKFWRIIHEKKLTVYMDFLYRRKETETLDYVMFVYILCDLMSELNWMVFF